ncbi:MAG: replication endonuclease [Gammaproteobacteria bacterium]|nr:MAG: replication endonuclease [Gammaproteobacteria bacterium]
MLAISADKQFVGFDGVIHNNEVLNHIGTRDCYLFREEIFSRNSSLSQPLRAEYLRMSKLSHISANSRLRELDDYLNPLKLNLLNENDSYLNDAAYSISLICTEIRQSYADDVDCYNAICKLAAAYAIAPPALLPDHSNVVSCLNRLCCQKFWRKKLRKLRGDRAEFVARELREVNAKKSLYCSDISLNYRRCQKANSRQFLESRTAINELNQEFTLAQLAELSPSNPLIRRIELINRLKGFELLSKSFDHDAVFITLTCPSRFHRMSKIVVNGRVVKCVPNKNYDGSDPKDAQKYLLKVWAKIMAKFGRIGVRPYGFRIAEPHHDGTPHHHFLLFASSQNIKIINDIFTAYALSDSPDEKGANEHRVKFELIKKGINPSTGREYSAVGYLIKYISKNVDGFRVDNSNADKNLDWADKSSSSIAERIEAWARTHRIRQFQQIGGGSVTVWREVRRLSEQKGLLEEIRQAAQANDWSAFVQLMGGPMCKREQQRVRPLYANSEKLDRVTGEIIPHLYTEYGDLASERILGVISAGLTVLSRVHFWEIRESETVLKAQQKIMIGISELLDAAYEQKYSHLYASSSDLDQQPEAA